MSKRLRKIIAIIALVCVGIFSVAFVAYLVDQTLLNGAIGFFTAFFGALGLALFLVIKLSRDNTDEIVDSVRADEEKDESKGESEDKAE